MWLKIYTSETSDVTSTPSKGMKVGNDNPNTLISTVRLNNFLPWFHSAQIYITSKGKLGYLTGATKAPDPTSATFPKWEAENAIVMSWLLHSMKPEISHTFMYLPTSKAIWDSMIQAYSRKGNKARMYDLRQKVSLFRQGDKSLSSYYSTLKGMWQEIDYYKTYRLKCFVDVVEYHKEFEENRVFDFLAGLNSEYYGIRIQILGNDPFPSLSEVYSYVQEEEDCQHAMFSPPPPSSIEKSVFISSTQHGGRRGSRDRGGGGRGSFQDGKGSFSSDERDKLKCEHCGRFRHTKNNCWYLHDRPQEFQSRP